MNQGSSSVSMISASNGIYLGTFLVRGQPWAAAPAGFNTMWIASSVSPDGGGGYLTKMGLDGGMIQTFNIQQQPAALLSIQYSDLPEPVLYFVDLNSNFLFRFDPITGGVSVVGPINGSGPQALLFDGTNIWTSNYGDNTVSKLDQYGIWHSTFPVGNLPFGLAFDGNSIWVANNSDSTVTQLSANDGQILQTIATGANPACIAFDGVNIWVTNMGDNTLTQIRASDGVVLRNLATELSPIGVVFDGANIWVANSGSNTVSRY